MLFAHLLQPIFADARLLVNLQACHPILRLLKLSLDPGAFSPLLQRVLQLSDSNERMRKRVIFVAQVGAGGRAT